MTSITSVLIARARARETHLPELNNRPLVFCCVLLILAGLAARLSPLADIDGRLFWQYMTEDGYLMQTIARNMAIGLGMSTSEGTIPTNGVQPLATFLFAGLHLMAGGSKSGGIILVTLFSTLVAVASAWLGFRVAMQVYAGLAYRRALALITSSLWFAAPQIVAHSMNGLETGVYHLAILCTLNFYLIATAGNAEPFSWQRRLLFGVLLGITFLARNDAVFLIAALLLAHLFVGRHTGGGYLHRLQDCVSAGLCSMVVALPWLVYNFKLFGSIVPISGTAQSHNAGLGQNLAYIPANLFENTFLFAPIPRALETTTPVIAAALVCVVLTVAAFWLLMARTTLATRRFCTTGLVFGAGIVVYYGVFFGAAHFIPRYTSPLSLFLWPAAVIAAYMLICGLFRASTATHRSLTAIAALLLVAAGAFAWSDFANGRSHLHKQVVQWVVKNVPDRQWVGAVQTGTLGYFHDRTINLDGKVNPDALRAKLKDGHVINYLLVSKIDYVVDWVGGAGWVDDGKYPEFSNQFEVAVRDKKLNLSVLRRVNQNGGN